MLTRKVIAAAGALLLSVTIPQTAHASVTTTVVCDKETHQCTVVAESPGHSGSNESTGSSHQAAPAAPPAASSGGRSGSPGGSSYRPPVVTSNGVGIAPPPASSTGAPATAPLTPMQIVGGSAGLAACGGRSAQYGQSLQTCLGTPTTSAPAATGPRGAAQPATQGKKKSPPPPTPAEVAAFAIATLHLPDPNIGSAPCTGQDCMGAVGVPVWLWTQPWPEPTATATIRGVSITATARITKVTWSMGDGNTVTCTTRGTPFDETYGFTDSPDCGYRYEHTSADQPGMRYPVTATATWRVTWDGDETGATTTTTLARTRLAIGEYQTVITG